MGKIENQAKKILSNYPIIKELPCSLSGRYHIGETAQEHLERTANIMRHLCDEFGVKEHDRDMLIAAAYLHDIGLYIITKKGKVDEPGWKYHKETNFSRLDSLMRLHPLLGAAILEDCRLGRKKDIQRLVSVHMSHWYHRFCPQPKGLYEYMICTADYFASRKNITEYTEKDLRNG